MVCGIYVPIDVIQELLKNTLDHIILIMYYCYRVRKLNAVRSASHVGIITTPDNGFSKRRNKVACTYT